MRLNFLYITLLIAAILVISGCTSPSPSPSPSAIVSPTTVPTNIASATPSPAATAVPSSSPVLTTTAGNLTVSGIAIDWDTTDPIQHDTARLTLQSKDTSVIQDVTVTYTVVTPFIVANSDGTTTTSNQSATSTVYVGKMSPTEVKNVTIQSPDHMKNVPAYVTIKVSWKGGEAVVFQAVLSAPDYKMGTQQY